MKLVTYRSADGARAGVLAAGGEAVYDVGACVDDEAVSVLDVVGQPEAYAARLASPSCEPMALSSLELLAPLPRPRRNIICVGKNYRDHSNEFMRSGFDSSAGANDAVVPDRPVLFTKVPECVIGPGEPIEPHRDLTSSLDYEAELAVIIGRGGRRISGERAWRHVWGYTIINDVTARDLQRDHRQWFLGKSLDAFCPMGPWAVSADEVDATDLAIRCWVNGELRQDARTRDLIFGIPELIETISAGMTLQPGDVIATGTPAGVGIGADPPRFLAPGDVVSIEVAGLGTLTNPVGSEQAQGSDSEHPVSSGLRVGGS